MLCRGSAGNATYLYCVLPAITGIMDREIDCGFGSDNSEIESVNMLTNNGHSSW